MLAVVLSSLLLASASPQGEVCTADRPTMQAGVNVNQGQYLFVLPRELPVGYSGCQVMWNEAGIKVWITHFEGGHPISAEIYDGPSSGYVKCNYATGKLKSGASDACPAAEYLERGLPSIEKAREGSLPLERDLRRKP
jgi:hypothetical protein